MAKREYAGTAQRWKHVPRTEPLALTFSTTYSTAWFDQPFSVEKFISNPGYREFTLGPLGPFEPRHIAQCLLRHEKALYKHHGVRYRREEAIKKIASHLGMKRGRVRNMLNRSSRVVPKRRKKRQHI